MLPRFPITSTNQLVQSAGQPANSETLSMLEIDRQIQELLRKFNLGVQGSFQAGGMQGLEHFSTASGYRRMQEKYANWTQRQITELNLVSCEFLSFDLAPDHTHAKAFTFEKWIFVYADGRQVPTSGSVDGYDLELVDGHWRVNTATTYAASPD